MTHRIDEFLEKISSDLDRTMKFWLKFSHDSEYGGFFNCIGNDGRIYDNLKYGWLQGRQVWTYAKLYNTLDRFKSREILDVAEKGAEFLMKYEKNPETHRCNFIMSQNGDAVKIQRTIFTESFYLQGLSELAIATGKQIYKDESIKMLDKIIYWLRTDDKDIGRPVYPGSIRSIPMNEPMILLSLLEQIIRMDASLTEKYHEHVEWCIEEILKHVQQEGKVILENVSPDGKEIPGSAGRLSSPGHAIEAGWFLLSTAQRLKREDLKIKAINVFMKNVFQYGWDQKHGGLFYFLDANGYCPTQLEWNMKLWWPHNEAMIAFLMAFIETKEQDHLNNFALVFDYAYSHFVDFENGEWFGYLQRNGEISLDFKGGPFKGCFHVPRCLLMCELLLKQIKAESN